MKLQSLHQIKYPAAHARRYITALSLYDHFKPLQGKFPGKSVCLVPVFERGEMDYSSGFYPRCKNIKDRIHPIRRRDDRTIEWVNREKRRIKGITGYGYDPIFNAVHLHISG
jgi:hypothetical protein